MNFIIGSTNEAKVNAANIVIANHFTQVKVRSIGVSSGVSNQPYGDEETRLGALNRALKACSVDNECIGIGLEGGVRILDEKLFICNWGALILPNGVRYTAGGAQIPLPSAIAEEIKLGKELGPVIENYYAAKGLRHKEGAIGVLTNGAINREELFIHIVKLLIGQWQYDSKTKKR